MQQIKMFSKDWTSLWSLITLSIENLEIIYLMHKFTFWHNIGMGNMSRIVNTKSNGQNYVDAGEGVNSHVPKMKHSYHVNLWMGEKN